MKKGKEWFIKELLGHEIGDYGNYYNGGYEDGLAYALKLAHQLDEPKRVVIPKFVAGTIDKFTNSDYGDKPGKNSVYNFIDNLRGDFRNGYHKETKAWYSESLQNEINIELAWLNGYEVEKEKLYYVLNGQGYFMLIESRSIGAMQAGNVTFEDAKERGTLFIYQLTEKQIKDYDERYWQFAVEVAE